MAPRGRGASPARSRGFAVDARVADLRHHGGGTAPLGAVRPYVLTIHDLQYRTYPEYFSRTKRAYLAAMIGRSVQQRADRRCAQSTTCASR